MLNDKIGINNHVLITPPHKKTYCLENMPVVTIAVDSGDMSRSQMENPTYGFGAIHDHGWMKLRRKLIDRIKLGIMKNIKIPHIDHLGGMKGLGHENPSQIIKHPIAPHPKDELDSRRVIAHASHPIGGFGKRHGVWF
jgi:hypothetical protein